MKHPWRFLASTLALAAGLAACGGGESGGGISGTGGGSGEGFQHRSTPVESDWIGISISITLPAHI